MRTETPIATCANDAAENAANNIARTIQRAIETLIVFNAVIRFSGLTDKCGPKLLSTPISFLWCKHPNDPYVAVLQDI
jgi:hypothetical protein